MKESKSCNSEALWIRKHPFIYSLIVFSMCLAAGNICTDVIDLLRGMEVNWAKYLYPFVGTLAVFLVYFRMTSNVTIDKITPEKEMQNKEAESEDSA